MSDVPSKYRQKIVDAIEVLRVRRFRPDAQRISGYCQRTYGLSGAEVKLDLERLVDEDAILKVRNFAEEQVEIVALPQPGTGVGATGSEAMLPSLVDYSGGTSYRDANKWIHTAAANGTRQ
ncbi:hypothetical protein RvY_13679 [Ramazzottius varieornatus]|uniref:SAMD1-like winged helix (WH) domain-containing protein n=1 Tax=Ramazzottius varieornatus TaxID=947166 RepID=A0A1D1VNQ6_RAMVA|nr:hypothetical protein RvY_13679 [Ramazzottius varieornatus]